MRLLLYLLFMLWTPEGRSEVAVLDLLGSVGSYVTVTGGYDPWAYKDYISSWCRQKTEEICDSILDSKGSNYNGRASMISNTPRTGQVRVTINDLKVWDSGLYLWRIWKGNRYEVLKKILLQVTQGWDPKNRPGLLHGVEGEEAKLECQYDQALRWSKVWCKQVDEQSCDWIAHSDGGTNPEYSQRATASIEPQSHRMALTLRKLQLWDTGLYSCQESGGSTVISKILLVVSKSNLPVQAYTLAETTLQTSALTIPLRTPPDSTIRRRNKSRPSWTERPLESKRVAPTQRQPLTNPERSNHTSVSATPTSGPKTRSHVWDILRWILFLVLITCTATVSCLKKK